MSDDRVEVPESGLDLDGDIKTLYVYEENFSYLNIVFIRLNEDDPDEAALLKLSKKNKLTLSQ